MQTQHQPISVSAGTTPGGPPHLATAILADLLERADHEMGRDIVAARGLLARATALLRPVTAAPQAARAGCLAPWQQRRVRELVAVSLHETLRVEDLASAVRLSTSYFTRAFKASFGETPHGYLLRMRVEQAQRMMLEGSEPLAQIALACGLADQAHMSRVFRQATGSSPSAWRRRHAAAI
ncbi:helix-turn-helix transcriptional regulator [Roseomonas stagni]|uniref:Helix-turn-helix transcriptional regulator n=1 Tax=Falsiroseomonas algicola TaxID=2716930 RepID=A0A6M1LUL0_9PROT|nr:AraC family transcriptional regulator [Falsiroseomonas algicola]NGM24176.1 helix-turn-helix transcriptional regulator [Falsiroseomonas algicola]